METWVPRIEDRGHEVIFFDGNNESVSFDSKNKLLHLIEDDSYDHDSLRLNNMGSLMFPRLQSAIKWCLENREFDYIFRIDDGSYVNVYQLDKMLNQLIGYDVARNMGGGAGVFLSKKVCEEIVKYKNTRNAYVEDHAIWNFLSEHKFPTLFSNLLCHQYILGEEYFTIHYTNGKRQYFTDQVLSYYFNGNPINRKVALNFPVICYDANKVNTWDVIGSDNNTPLYYSFDRDKFDWEHYGFMCRSSFTPKVECPFGENSIKELLLYDITWDIEKSHELDTFLKYIKSVKDNGKIYFFYKEENEFISNISNYLSVIKIENNINLDMEYSTNEMGIFLTAVKLI
jgi:hypothetical protein